MKLYREEIRENCDDTAYQRGDTINYMQKIFDVDARVGSQKVILTGSIRQSASETNHCSIEFERMRDDSLSITDYNCDCYSFDSWYGMCKHCAALCICYANQLKARSGLEQTVSEEYTSKQETDAALMDVLQRYSSAQEGDEELAPGSLHVAVEFTRVHDYYKTSSTLYVSMKAGGNAHLYVVKSIPFYIHSVIHGAEYQYGKKLKARHSMKMFDPVSQKMLQILTESIREKYSGIEDTRIFYNNTESFLSVSNAHAAALLRLSMEATGFVIYDKDTYRAVNGDPPVTLSIRKQGNGALLSVPNLVKVCSEPTAICLFDHTAYFCTDEFQKKSYPFLNAIGAITETVKPEVEKYLSEKDYSRFVAFVLPKLKETMKVDEGDVDFSAYLPQTPEFSFYISGTGEDGLALRPEVSYGGAVYPLEKIGSEYRNKAAEKPVLDEVAYYFPHEGEENHREAITDDEIYLVVEEGLDKLREFGAVLVDEAFHLPRVEQSPRTNVGVALHEDLIDINVNCEGYGPAEINAILDAYKLKKKYYRLKSGEFLSLAEGGLSVVAELSEGIDLRFDENGKAQTPAFRAAYINSVLDREDTLTDMHRNAAFKAQILALKNYRDEEYEIPKALQATLRGYQKSGYRWLCSLASCSLGGILADDMGLGKTVQMLSYFLASEGSFLVVCPASLIYNWESECRRFAPSIPCHIMRGTEEERKEELKNEGGLTITSYGQLRRDVEFYKDKHFDCCVLDEAQYIRNAETKAAKAVKQINATHRFALTGTPIENRLSDLWSIFDFLMPGYLFGKKDFRARIEQPVVDGEDAAKERLTKLTAPFILRRKKADVLKELPEKQETVVYVDMTDTQRKLYNAQEQALRMTLQNTADAEYLHHKIEYLAALTRLRQICCAPELYLENYAGGSGKVDACMELLTEGAESGHKTLVFSQFTGMLELLIDKATKEGLKWLYLSGKNTSEQRRDMVQQFQTGDYSVFFISLKAGGTGLNLTAADRVLHFDPWWNVAAEEQAADRTHRIGQKNKVMVTKLVCKDTIEERIIALQERKRTLSDLVLNDENTRSATIDKAALLELLQSESGEK